MVRTGASEEIFGQSGRGGQQRQRQHGGGIDRFPRLISLPVFPLCLPVAFAGTVSVFCPSCELRSPTGLAFDSAGNLFVVNSSSIVQITTAGVGTQFAFYATLNNPNQMAIDSANNLYIANTVRGGPGRWGVEQGGGERGRFASLRRAFTRSLADWHLFPWCTFCCCCCRVPATL